MCSPPTATTAEAWLEWFTAHKQAACRTYLCHRYHLNELDAAALMNDALLQVFRHWRTIRHPLAYFWHTLRHALSKQGHRQTYEQRQLMVYVQQQRSQDSLAKRTARHVAEVLERVSPRQGQLLEWFAQGYEDTQVAAWLGTTPQAIRVARHSAYRALRAQLTPSAGAPPVRARWLHHPRLPAEVSARTSAPQR